jgi:serine phosphatase RsbU (regulator of sigma subunit)
MTKHLAAERDLHHLLDLIIQQACRALHCERATVFLYDEGRQELYSSNLTHPLESREIRLPWDQGIVGLVARQQRMVHIADPYGHPLFRPDFDRRNHFRTRNILAAPLLSWTDRKLIGVLYLLNKEAGLFSELDGELLGLIATHASIALERAVLARNYEEAKVAGRIQAGFFPRSMPAIPGYEVVGTSQPAEQAGGDYFDVIPLPSGTVGLAIADVCGHGLGPSLLMASLRATLRGSAIREGQAAASAVLDDVNRALFDDLEWSRRFITALYGVLDPAAHRFQYANAGHGPVALHLQADAGRIVSLADDRAGGCPLGILREPYRHGHPVTLAPGDLLVLGSDGLVETRRGGECFGMDRFGQILLRNHRLPLQEVLASLFEATNAFNEAAHPEDDLTLLMVRRT